VWVCDCFVQFISVRSWVKAEGSPGGQTAKQTRRNFRCRAEKEGGKGKRQTTKGRRKQEISRKGSKV
jgi:hypothetical protein